MSLKQREDLCVDRVFSPAQPPAFSVMHRNAHTVDRSPDLTIGQLQDVANSFPFG